MRKYRIVALVLMAAFLAGCATLSSVKPWSERTPKEKSLSFLQMYNRQYEDTLRMATTPNLTEGQKAMVRTKKKLLTEVRPMLDIYVSTVIDGRMPSADLEAKILMLIDKLSAAGG